jgi:hypothetical protein
MIWPDFWRNKNMAVKASGDLSKNIFIWEIW